MSVASGLEARLVASEPLIRQPVAIEFDDRAGSGSSSTCSIRTRPG